MKAIVEDRTPEEYISELDEPRRSEVQALHDLIRATVPHLAPVVVQGMIGYGMTRYKYKSGREGEWPLLALSSRKAHISVYAAAADASGYVAERYKDRLPKATIGKSCIGFKRLSDIDLEVLKELLVAADAIGMGSAIS